MIGETLGRYRILEKLGEGAMGEVYRTRDPQLSRDIALKVLPATASSDPQRRERFEREAKSLAALNHAGIVTIHSIERAGETTFITMELVRGVTLREWIKRGRPDLEEFLRLAVGLADALTAAHEHGIVHRDLKPDNIMVDEEGRPKILDFGLVKLLEPVVPSETTVLQGVTLTKPGFILGTPAYMAPEQIEGRTVDHRVDLFALGSILFELATGRSAFTGESTPAVMSAILRDRPPRVSDLRPDWPRDVSRIVGRCLEKDPRKRFQTARDVLNELRELRRESTAGDAPVQSAESGVSTRPSNAPARWPWIAALVVMVVVAGGVFWFSRGRNSGPTEQASPMEERLMIAVLPFENLGPPDNDYFAAGITEEITSRLAGVSELGVISRTSTIQYEGTTKPLREIGQELGVNYVLEGTVTWAPGPEGKDRVRITPQLIRVSDDTHLWTDRYEDVLRDVFAVQSEIAKNVVRELGITLLKRNEEALERKPTKDLAAYEAYLRARKSGSTLNAISLLEHAVALDPGFPEAWALLSNMHAKRYRWEGDRTPAQLATADSTIARAMALDPDNPEVLWAAAYTRYYVHDDYDDALKLFDRLLEQNPSSAHAFEGKGYIRRRQGRLDEAVTLIENARRLDPRDSNIVFNLARTWGAQRQFAVADSLYRAAIALSPNNCTYYERWAFVPISETGDLKKAVERIESCPGGKLYARSQQIYSMAGDYAKTLDLVETSLNEEISLAYRGAMHTVRAWCLKELGRDAEARVALATARDFLRAALKAGPDNAMAHAMLALNLVTSPASEEALDHARKAVKITAPDRFDGPTSEVFLAGVLLHLGHTREGLEILDKLLVEEYDDPLTVPYLRVHWLFRPFRNDPGFRQLLARHEGRNQKS